MAAADLMTAADRMTEWWLAQEDGGSRELVRRFGLSPGVVEEFSRLYIIQELQKIVSEWIVVVADTRNQKEEQDYSAELAYYGSYGLEVHSPGSDLDVIVIGPSFAKLEDDFLVRLYDDLVRKLPRAIDVQSIPGAKVPLIKFRIDGISVDMCYARVNLKTIPKAEEIQFFTLAPLDSSGKLALSSLLMNVTLSNMIPNGNGGERFGQGVKLIKLWGERRGLSGNVIGYMGGVHWTVLFAYAYRKYPTQPLIWLLSFFFMSFSVWMWPTPVLFDSTAKIPRHLLMPIQKPGSTEVLHSNVKKATLGRITSEFRRAASITQGMRSISDLSHPECHLFKTFDYKGAYHNFLKIRISVPEGNDAALNRWVGLAQSRFPDLINKLEVEGLLVDPTLTEYRDTGKGNNKVFLWGVIKERGGGRILFGVQESWADSLRRCGEEGDIYLAMIPVDTYALYTALH